MPDSSLIFDSDVSEYGGSLIAQELLRRPDRATALRLNYELMALGVYNELRAAGDSAPEKTCRLLQCGTVDKSGFWSLR